MLGYLSFLLAGEVVEEESPKASDERLNGWMREEENMELRPSVRGSEVPENSRQTEWLNYY